MRNFLVNVNGTTYQIGVEEIDAETAAKRASDRPQKKESTSSHAANAGAVTVSAPMPGNILSVNVKNGDAVKQGDILLILEAMKMENEILAPSDGTVDELFVSVGQSVDTGAALVALK